jgi:hypothetical protein
MRIWVKKKKHPVARPLSASLLRQSTTTLRGALSGLMADQTVTTADANRTVEVLKAASLGVPEMCFDALCQPMPSTSLQTPAIARCGHQRKRFVEAASSGGGLNPVPAQGDCLMYLRRLVASAVIGAVLGLAIGYVAYKATGGLFDFSGWITQFGFGRPLDALLWALGGAIVGAAAAYLRNLNDG